MTLSTKRKIILWVTLGLIALLMISPLHYKYQFVVGVFLLGLWAFIDLSKTFCRVLGVLIIAPSLFFFAYGIINLISGHGLGIMIGLGMLIISIAFTALGCLVFRAKLF